MSGSTEKNHENPHDSQTPGKDYNNVNARKQGSKYALLFLQEQLSDILGSHGGEYEDWSLLGADRRFIVLMMEAVRTSETSVDNHFTRQYIPEDSSEHHTRRRENLKSHNSIQV
jgi:hypothetical protein